MATKLIIILDKDVRTGLFRCALWADVPLARQSFYANPVAKSIWTGASPAEHAAIAAGQVTERVITLQVSDGATVPSLQEELITQQARFQAEIATANPWRRYGTFFDGISWTAGGL